MSATALPGLTPGRQPYPGGSDRHVPIVPHVLIIGERKGYYLPPVISRAETVYDTPTTVRVKLPQGRQETQVQHKVWAIPDDAAWAEVEAAVGAFGQRLADLANVLRELGRYKDRLAAARGFNNARNPLCLTVARIDDPDTKNPTTWWLSAWHTPRLDRAPIERHTPKMLSSGGTGSYVFSQDNCFVLEDDAAWERVEAAHKAAEQAAEAANDLLGRLGTYQDALDGRHAARVAPAERAVGAPPAAAAVREHLTHALNWTGPGAPAYHLEQARAELEQVQATAPGLALELEREIAAADAQVAAREAGEKSLAVVTPAVDGIVVMTADEARQAADAIKVAVEDLRVKIDDFDQGQGWKALGYDSFRAWAAAEIPDTSLRHVYRLRDAAEVDRSLGVTIGHTPESHARELKSVPTEQRADVLKQADERAQGAGRGRTAADIKAVTNGHTSATSDPLATVAAELRRGDTQAAYVAARGAAGDDHLLALAAIDARVEGRPLEEALTFLAADPADIVTQSLKDGSRRVLALRRAGVLALTPAWLNATDTKPMTIWPDHYTITHIPTGKAVGGGHIEGRPKADATFEALAALDWSGIEGQMPALLSEQVARIFGLSFPSAEAYETASARARARELTLMRTTRSGVSGAPYYLLGEAGRQEQLDRWVDVLARLDALENPAAEPPAPFDAQAWSRRASAAGANLLIYADGYRLVERGETQGTRYEEGEISALIAHIERLEAQPPPPPANTVPLDEEAPDPEIYAYGEAADGETVVLVDRTGLHLAVADAIAAAAAALRSLALGETVNSKALDDLVERLGEAPEAGRATLISVLQEIASDADILAGKGFAR